MLRMYKVVMKEKNCYWCLQPVGKHRSKFCSTKCDDQHKVYKKRMGPIWMWRLYSKYKIYKIFYNYIPKIKNLFITKIPNFFIKILKKFKKKFKKFQTHLKYFKYKIHKAKICGHWTLFRYKRDSNGKYFKNFCSDKCRQIHDQKIIETRKQRNLAAWGTEHRPEDPETRRIIKNKKHAEWDKQKKIDDPAHKLIRRMRLRTKKVLGVNYRRETRKTDVYTRLCIKDGQELKRHLEFLWKPGMSWNNYGKQDGWVIDHIVPLKYYKNNFDLANDIEIQKKAFGIQNLQPLWWLENAKKSAKLNYGIE